MHHSGLRQHYTRGKMEILESRPKLVQVAFSDCVGFDVGAKHGFHA
jgi:hypothetical protein